MNFINNLVKLPSIVGFVCRNLIRLYKSLFSKTQNLQLYFIFREKHAFVSRVTSSSDKVVDGFLFLELRKEEAELYHITNHRKNLFSRLRFEPRTLPGLQLGDTLSMLLLFFRVVCKVFIGMN